MGLWVKVNISYFYLIQCQSGNQKPYQGHLRLVLIRKFIKTLASNQGTRNHTKDMYVLY